jgi:hypothetical protein
MSLNPVHITAPRPDKIAISGIGASNSPARLIDVLSRLGLMPRDLSDPLKSLAAAGQKPGDHFKVSVWKLDEALNRTDASTVNRMALKASLSQFNMLSVER